MNDETIREIFKEWERQQEALVESLEKLSLMASLILVVQGVVLVVAALQVYWAWPLI